MSTASTNTDAKPPADDNGLQVWNVTEPYLNLHCGLGEGPYYEAAAHSLRFVDIKKQRVHTVDLTAAGSSPSTLVTTIQLDTPVAVTADIEGVDPHDRIAIGAKYGVAVLDRRTGAYEYVTRFSSADGKDGKEDDERLRSNDGAVDPHGRFWLGTMTDIGLDLQPEGEFSAFLQHNFPTYFFYIIFITSYYNVSALPI